MENGAFLWVLTIAQCVISLGAGYAGALWMRDSRYKAWQKRLTDLERQMSDLESSFGSLMDSHKRLRSRAGMRELRERRQEDGPETKLEVRRRIFGASSGPAFARIQATLNANHPD